MAIDPGALGADHPYVLALDAGKYPGTTVVPVLDTLNPATCLAGPPADVKLVATGSGFVYDTAIAFGTWPDGTPRFERTTHELDGSLSTIITAGMFPGVDPAVPVLLGNVPPNGPRSAVLPFAIT